MSWFSDALESSGVNNALYVMNPLTYLTTIGPGRQVAGIETKSDNPYVTPTQAQNIARRQADWQQGLKIGREQFYDDPDMQRMRQLRENLQKGYEGSELGGLRQEARGQLAGKQAAEMRNLQARQARQGVGGARAAAMQGQLGRQFTGATADAERKLALQQGELKRAETDKLQDFMFRQKYGSLGTAAGMAQMGSQDYASQQQRQLEASKKSPNFFNYINPFA